jgi:hypothetical protein
MASRLKLQEYLETLCDNVYFQPPASVHMNYPAIRYSRIATHEIYADDIHYHQTRGYKVIVIDRDPDSPIVDKVMNMPLCQHTGHMTVEGLNQDSFTLYW